MRVDESDYKQKHDADQLHSYLYMVKKFNLISIKGASFLQFILSSLITWKIFKHILIISTSDLYMEPHSKIERKQRTMENKAMTTTHITRNRNL